MKILIFCLSISIYFLVNSTCVRFAGSLIDENLKELINLDFKPFNEFNKKYKSDYSILTNFFGEKYKKKIGRLALGKGDDSSVQISIDYNFFGFNFGSLSKKHKIKLLSFWILKNDRRIKLPDGIHIGMNINKFYSLFHSKKDILKYDISDEFPFKGGNVTVKFKDKKLSYLQIDYDLLKN